MLKKFVPDLFGYSIEASLQYFFSRRQKRVSRQKFSAVSEKISSESALLSAGFLNSETWGFQCRTALIHSESALIFTHVDENIKV